MLVLSAVATSCLAASLGIWVWIVSRWSQRKSLLDTTPRRPVPWQGSHVAIAFLIYVLLPALGMVIIGRSIASPNGAPGDANDMAPIVVGIMAISLLSPLAAGLIFALLRMTRSATAADLGWSRTSIGRDITIGLVTFLAIAPIVYGLQAVLNMIVQWIWGEPILHPIIKQIQENPTPQVLFWSAIAVVLVAPIVEEFLFRVVLQGWLESLVTSRPQPVEVIEPAIASDSTDDAQTPYVEPDRDPADAVAAHNPYEAPAVTQSFAIPEETSSTIPWYLAPIPVVLSALTFSLFHLGQGPAPIPLFFLALALGYVYLRTHRMLPCVLIHMALNASSMAVLWVSLE